MTKVVGGCDFNPDMTPDSIITFGEQDLVNLLSIEENTERSSQVNKTCAKILCAGN